MSRAVISVDRVEFNPADNTLTIYERKDSPPFRQGIGLTPLWNLWCCSQLIFHLPMKVSCIIMVPIAARIEGKRGEKTPVNMKRQSMRINPPPPSVCKHSLLENSR